MFATWTARVQPDDNFIAEFNAAISIGMKMIPEIAKAESNDLISEELIYSYLTKSIDFNFDDKKKEALKLFLQLSKDI
ncbi:MAG: hypothetical protein IPN88_01500 [Bacteroidetes bacterium]|nr:hypothetical protein [Bacteroidota bacterium]